MRGYEYEGRILPVPRLKTSVHWEWMGDWVDECAQQNSAPLVIREVPHCSLYSPDWLTCLSRARADRGAAVSRATRRSQIVRWACSPCLQIDIATVLQLAYKRHSASTKKEWSLTIVTVRKERHFFSQTVTLSVPVCLDLYIYVFCKSGTWWWLQKQCEWAIICYHSALNICNNFGTVCFTHSCKCSLQCHASSPVKNLQCESADMALYESARK